MNDIKMKTYRIRIGKNSGTTFLTSDPSMGPIRSLVTLPKSLLLGRKCSLKLPIMDPIDHKLYPIFIIIKAGDILIILAPGRFKLIFTFHGDFLQGFQTIRNKGRGYDRQSFSTFFS